MNRYAQAKYDVEKYPASGFEKIVVFELLGSDQMGCATGIVFPNVLYGQGNISRTALDVVKDTVKKNNNNNLIRTVNIGQYIGIQTLETPHNDIESDLESNKEELDRRKLDNYITYTNASLICSFKDFKVALPEDIIPKIAKYRTLATKANEDVFNDTHELTTDEETELVKLIAELDSYFSKCTSDII